jgi:hypothetical protein
MCFVAMPSGAPNPIVELAFTAWYRGVFDYAAQQVNHRPYLSTEDAAPRNITSTIRRYLATVPLAIFDLSGAMEGDATNPNVAYELGLRHAFGLPAVLYASTADQLPFDTQEQWAVVTPRRQECIPEAREKLTACLRSALSGHFYNPMAEVAMFAKLSALGTSPEFSAIVEAIQKLSDRVDQLARRQSEESRQVAQARRQSLMELLAYGSQGKDKEEFTPSYMDLLKAQKGEA